MINFDLGTLLTTENLLMLAIAICASASITVAAVFIYRVYTLKKDQEDFDTDFSDIFVPEFDEYEETGYEDKNGLLDKWNHYWKDRSRKAGIQRYTEANEKIPGRDAAMMALVIGFLVGVVTLNVFFGIIALTVVPIIHSVLLGIKINQVEASLNSQVPSFLATFKSNIQANETPERALIKVIDDIGDPLYSELAPTKRKIQSGTDMGEALEDLKSRTTSYELQFLCSCIKIASEYGADLEKQVDTIQGVIAERQKVSDKLASAARAARPAMFVGTLIIPAMFFIIYMFYEQAQDFWFVDPISYIALLMIAIFYGAGMWFSKIMVDNLKKM